jgi:hypothetical protein
VQVDPVAPPPTVCGRRVGDLLAVAVLLGGREFSHRVRAYAVFLRAALTFAHRARCAAAIFLRAAADIVFFLGIVTTFCFCLPVPRTFAHRALWAAAILARAAVDRRLRLPVPFPETPVRAARAASSCSTVLTARCRSFRNCWTTPAKLAMNPPRRGLYQGAVREPILRRFGYLDRVPCGWGVSQVQAAFVTTPKRAIGRLLRQAGSGFQLFN